MNELDEDISKCHEKIQNSKTLISKLIPRLEVINKSLTNLRDYLN